MNKNDIIFISGHKGLVGSSVLSSLKKQGFKKIITADRKKLDLRDYKKVEIFFKKKKIDYMVMAAAKAGGIIANSTNQKDFFLENIEIFTLAESLGGVESLVCHPATMTHASMPEELRAQVGITDGLIRLSVGIEDIDDLKDDISNALKAL